MNMAIVLTDLGTTLKLAGNINEAVQKYVLSLGEVAFRVMFTSHLLVPAGGFSFLVLLVSFALVKHRTNVSMVC